MFQPMLQPLLTFGSKDMYVHTNERKALAWDHPRRFSAVRNALFDLGVLSKPNPTDKLKLLQQDYLEDTINVTAGSYVLALLSTLHRLGGHIPSLPSFSGRNVFTIPDWASRLLHQVRMIRYFSTYWAVGMTYVTTYNLLTGFLGFPVNEYHNFHPAASLASVLPTAFLYAALNPHGRPERAWTGRATPFVGRAFLSGCLGVWAATFAAMRLSQQGFFTRTQRTGKDSFFDTLQNAPPSAELVAQAPYIPYYKEAPTIPNLPIRNPLHDPGYVADAKAKVKKLVDEHY